MCGVLSPLIPLFLSVQSLKEAEVTKGRVPFPFFIYRKAMASNASNMLERFFIVSAHVHHCVLHVYMPCMSV